jgi:hypothetical protein
LWKSSIFRQLIKSIAHAHLLFRLQVAIANTSTIRGLPNQSNRFDSLLQFFILSDHFVFLILF